MRAIKKGIAALLCAAMVITLAPAGNAGAAKKPKLNKKNVSVGVGETVKIKVKNAKKKAKVTWKTSKKAVAKITKKVSKGKKASATVMGVKVGKAKITAVYKLGKSKKKLNCTVTVHSTSIQQPQASAGAVVLPSNAPVVSGTPEVSTPPVVEGTPTARPKRSPTPEPTPTPSPLPDPGVEFEVPSNGYAIDVASFNCTAGSGKYDSTLQRVEINDNDPSGGSQGNWELPAEISSNIKDGDLVTFRVQGYNYGDSGFRFWIGNPNSGGCTPVMLVDQVAEGLGIDPELGYPCVKDDAGNVLEGKKGEDIQSSPQLNQMAINADPETHAFDVTFTFKAATSQNDTNSTYSHFVVKHIMSGGTAGYINGLAIKNIYYISENGEVPSVPTADPDEKGIDLSGTKAIYGQGTVKYDEATQSVTGESVQGLMVPIGDVAEGETLDITLYGEAGTNARAWLSTMANSDECSAQVNPALWSKTYSYTATKACDALQIKKLTYDAPDFTSIKLTKVVVKRAGEAPTPSENPTPSEDPTPSAKPDPTPSKEPEPTPTEAVDPTQAPTDEPAPSEGPEVTSYSVDLSKGSSYTLEGADMKASYDEAAAVLDVTAAQYQGIIFKLPEDQLNNVYKYVKITYTTSANINAYLFDDKMTDGTGQQGAGQHTAKENISSDDETTLILAADDSYSGNCIKGLKFVNFSGTSSLKIKSITFYKENPEAPTVSEAPTPSEGPTTVDIDLTKAKTANGVSATITPNGDGSVTATNAEGFSGLVLDLPQAMNEGDAVEVYVEYEGAGSTARAYLINDGNDNMAAVAEIPAAESVVDGVLIAKGSANQIYVKAKTYSEKFTSLTIKKLTVTIYPKQTEIKPGDIKLYTARANGGAGHYDYKKGQLVIDDASGTSEVHIDLLEKIAANAKATITVKGTWSGTTGFRVWIGNGYNNQSDGPKVLDSLSAGAFEETFTLTATSECNILTIKSIGSSPIDGLAVESISIKVEEAEPTPTPTTDPSKPAWDGVVKLSQDNVALNDGSNKATFNEDGTLDLELNWNYSGFGIYLYLTEDHTDVDISQYSKVVIEYEAEDEYPLCIELRAGEISDNYWAPGGTTAVTTTYHNCVKGSGTIEKDGMTGSASVIFIKYNTWYDTNTQEPPKWVSDQIMAKIKIKSIKLVK